MLKRRGSPIVVASAYRSQRSLIGPTLFPLYWMILRFAIVFTGIAVLTGTFFAARTKEVLLSSILSSLWTSLFSTAAMITLIFAMIENSPVRAQILNNWKPEKLPPARNPRYISRAESIFGIVANAFAIWLCAVNLYLRAINVGSGVVIRLYSVWTDFMIAVVLLASANAIAAAINLARPYQTRGRLIWRTCADIAGSILFYLVMRTPLILGIVNQGHAESTNANEVVRHWAPVSIVIGAFAVGADLYRLWRFNRGETAPTAAAALASPR